MKRMRGVTLIELMTVVTIIGILAAVAYPAYMEQARRGRRAAGVAMLQNVLQQSERYYSENNTYTTDLTQLGYTLPVQSEHQTHVIGLTTCDVGTIASCVKVTATPNGTDAKCNVISLQSNNKRDATGTQPSICW